MAANRRRTKGAPGPRRNSAPMWKKVCVVLSGPVAAIVLISLLHARDWNIFLFFAFVVVVFVVAIWGTAKLLGVRLSLGSWD